MLPLAARLGLISAAEPGKHWKQPFELLDRRVEMLDQWTAEAQKASASLEKGKPGEPPPELLDWLLSEIAVIWEEHTKRRFSRSENRGGAYEFVRSLIALSDPKVGPGTLDHAMRRVIGGIRPKENS
jgi:hypothetical protein